MRSRFFHLLTAMKSWAAISPKKLSFFCFRWKQVSTAMVPLISCHNPLPHKLPRQRQLQLCRGDLEGMLRDVLLFPGQVHGSIRFILKFCFWNLEVYELPFTINETIVQGKAFGNESHRFPSDAVSEMGSAACTWCWLILMVIKHAACRNHITKMFSKKGCCSEV